MKHLRHLVVLFVFMLLFQPVSAQTSPPPTTCPYQQACEIIQQATGLLQKYNIAPTELDSLLKAFGTGGQEGIAGRLMELGLDQAQTGALLQEAAPLLQSGMNNSYIQGYIGELVNGSIKENDDLASRQQEIITGLRNPDNILAILNELGIEGEEAEAFLNMTQFVTELGYSPATFERTAQANAIYALLLESDDTLSGEDLSYLTMLSLSDLEAFEAEAIALGVDVAYVYDNFEDAYTNFFLENGISEDEIEAFQELAFASAVIELGDDPEALANLLASYGYEDDMIAELLNGYDGWASPSDLVDFLGALGLGINGDFDDIFSLYDDADFIDALEDWDFDDMGSDENTDDENTDGENTDG